jgi:hypothetical protein
MRLQRLLLPPVIALLGALPAAALAQAAGAQGNDFLYRVQKDDTLIGVSTRYTLTPNNWQTLQQLNHIADPTRLSIGKVLHIPFALIPETASTADVTHVSGLVRTGSQALAEGRKLGEGSVVSTGSDGFATLKLDDTSVLTVPASSTLTIERLRTFKGTGLIDSVITLGKGGLESTVAPRHTGVGRFEVHTPISITGVRGTHLRVRNGARGAQSEVVQGQALVASPRQDKTATLHADQGTAVAPDGRILAVRKLLPAPALPKPARGGASGWRMAFPPVPGASAYLVRVASDPATTQLVSTQTFTKPDVTFNAPGAGTFYVAVRAIDPDGIEGNDAVQSFPGTPVLHSADGLPVLSGFGHPILLSDF